MRISEFSHISRQILRGWVIMGFVILGATYLAKPSWFRVLTPHHFGAAYIGDNIYTDAPERAADLRAMVQEAKRQNTAYFGLRDVNPRIVICTSRDCAKTFNARAQGMAFYAHLIIISPGGVQQAVLTHEMAHIYLHSYFGLRDVRDPRFAAWFDEGLATYIAGGANAPAPVELTNVSELFEIETYLDWYYYLFKGGPLSDRYRYVRDVVAYLEAKIGREGMLALIQRVKTRAEFDAVMRDLLSVELKSVTRL